jgi:hypothetical protein
MVHQYKILDVPKSGTPIFSQDILIASQSYLLSQNFSFQLDFFHLNPRLFSTLSDGYVPIENLFSLL